MKNILITGGSGLVGRRLTVLLKERGYGVRHLSRSGGGTSKVSSYRWNPMKGEIDDRALEGVHGLFHLAGAGVADKRWSGRRKEEIARSRIEGAALLHEKFRERSSFPAVYISASAVGLYGDQGDRWVDEESPRSEDFLGEICEQWEEAGKAFHHLGSRTVFIRTGIVLSREGGALPKMSLPIRLFAGAPLGSGEQFISWIHIDDLCGIYLKALEDERMEGPYNGVAPNPLSNRELTRLLASSLSRPLFLPAVPLFVLKIFLGEMSRILVESTRVSCQKIQRAGYVFQYDRPEEALKALYEKQ